ncbi:hypothetical protein EV645_4833 [Kribbella rubisoli]|uniref:Uncharacterized protein n=1 Tax=Kribbella rubisoli TaxID=3075929 RepID=A0A4Q7WVC2_9ACTN|nr:hypothetical protein EV645_4833 [Kribbella rubisoli]
MSNRRFGMSRLVPATVDQRASDEARLGTLSVERSPL